MSDSAKVRLAILGGTLLYLWFSSLFTHTTHQFVGGTHVFAYNMASILFGVCFNIIPLGAAWFLGRVKRDKVGAAICLLMLPFFILFILPTYFMERVKITSTHLIHRREPPHTRYNADIAFDQIDSAVEIHTRNGMTGYLFRLKDGRHVEFPGNTVMTAATPTIAEELGKRHLPIEKVTEVEIR